MFFDVAISEASSLLHLYGGVIKSPPGTTKNLAYIHCLGREAPVSHWGILPGNEELLSKASGVCEHCLERMHWDFVCILSGLSQAAQKAKEPRS